MIFSFYSLFIHFFHRYSFKFDHSVNGIEMDLNAFIKLNDMTNIRLLVRHRGYWRNIVNKTTSLNKKNTIFNYLKWDF